MVALIGKIDEAGGMYKAAEVGIIQTMIGDPRWLSKSGWKLATRR